MPEQTRVSQQLQQGDSISKSADIAATGIRRQATSPQQGDNSDRRFQTDDTKQQLAGQQTEAIERDRGDGNNDSDRRDPRLAADKRGDTDETELVREPAGRRDDTGGFDPGLSAA